MPYRDLFSQLREFKTDNLKRVSTKVTAGNGQQYVETLQDCGDYLLCKSGFSEGYVVDNRADITVALIVDGLILGNYFYFSHYSNYIKICPFQSFNVFHKSKSKF